MSVSRKKDGDLDHGCGRLGRPNWTGSHVYLLTHDKTHSDTSHAHHVTKACVPDDAKTIPALWCDAKLLSHNQEW
jgi:hypothetical protein